MRHVALLAGLFAVVSFAQACRVTTTDGTVTATNRATGEIREFDSEAEVPDGWAVCEGDVCPDPLACSDIDEAACLARGDCAPIYEPDGSFDGCVDGGVDTCSTDECGPMPGAPAYECWDGSIGGNTGRCIDLGDGCGWEFRECPPPPSCSWDDCPDPAPGIANWECSDGSMGGPACVPAADGSCGWAILECPEDGTCDDSAKCGPALGMPAYVCEDGSTGGNTGRCLDNGDGTCSWEIRECPEQSQGG